MHADLVHHPSLDLQCYAILDDLVVFGEGVGVSGTYILKWHDVGMTLDFI